MDRDLLKRALFILSVSSIVTFSTLKIDQNKKRENVKKYLFENQANFLTKKYQLTKEDSAFVVKEISFILKNPDISFHAKSFIEHIDYYRAGTLTKKSCYPAFNRFYKAFTNSLSNQKLDSLYPVLEKYSAFKYFEKIKKASNIIFKSKFRDYFFEKYIEVKKPKPRLNPFDTKSPKNYFAKEVSKKKPIVRKKIL